MKLCYFFVFAVLGIIVVVLPPTDGRRGGGGSRGGSRGSSSRGSSGRTSSSRGTTSQRGSNMERKTSKSESSDQHKVPTHQVPELKNPAVKPSAPELPSSAVKPSAPELPSAGRGNNAPPPPYPGSSVNRPPQQAGQPPPYPGTGHGQQPPPYPGPSQNRPPPYDFGQRQPGGLPDQPGFRPNVQSGNNPGIRPYPQQPNVGNQPYPQQPNMGHNPYPQQPRPYPQQPAPYPQQPAGGYRPYPQQPAGGYRPYPQQPSYSAPSYSQYSGIPVGGSSYAQPYKKKGLLGNLFSSGKSHKSSMYGGAGGMGGFPGGGYYNKGGHGMSRAMYPLVPMMMMKSHKPKMRFPFFMPIFLPRFGGYGYGDHHYYNYHNYPRYHPYNDINSDEYRGGCRIPLTAGHNSVSCNATEMGAKCKAECDEGYHYVDNSTVKENECWHVGGVWRPKKNFEACQPICNSECQHGGKCSRPGFCHCDPEYRGDKCEHHILECDVRKLAREKSRYITWTCRHSRNDTTCNIRCRNPANPLEVDNFTQVQCTITGEWVKDRLPICKEDEVPSTESPATTTGSPDSAVAAQ